MKQRTISLRTKLICVIAVVIAATSLPLVYFGYSNTFNHSMTTAREEFSRIARIVEEELQLAYLNSEMLIVGKADIEKGDISTELDAIEAWVGSNQFDNMNVVLKFMEERWSTSVAVSNEWGEYLAISQVVAQLQRQNPKDYLGVPFRDYLRNASGNFYRDYSTFTRLTLDDGTTMPLLVVVRKVAGYTVIITQLVDYLEEQMANQEALFRERIKSKVASLELGPEVSLRIFSGLNDVVADRGPAGHDHEHDPSLLERAKTEGSAWAILPDADGESLYSVQHFKVLDWYIEASSPVDLIAEPARVYALKLAAILLFIFALMSAGGFILVTRFLEPLARLTDAARKLEKVNFLSDNTAQALHELVRDLPRKRRDETGQISRAFTRMVVALAKNIRELKDSLARQHSIEGELNAAREIQDGMLANNGGTFKAPGVLAAATMDAAKEVGGDFYDVVTTLPDGRAAFVLGDVSGKGVSAALLMCVTLTLVRNALSENLSPAQIMKKVNDQLAANNPTCMFVTLWIGILDPKTGALSYANGGHCPPAVFAPGSGRPVRWLRDVSGPLVGALDMAEFVDLETTLALDETCFVYSDGVSEAMDEAHRLFGEGRIESVLTGLPSGDPQGAVEAMFEAVKTHRRREPQSDDITMLVFCLTKEQQG